jgi:hypothetical protein
LGAETRIVIKAVNLRKKYKINSNLEVYIKIERRKVLLFKKSTVMDGSNIFNHNLKTLLMLTQP